MQWLQELNQQQRQAAEASDGPLVIIAGPGTGKTKTLTARIVQLIKSGRAKPDELVALTFTRKAAAEMRHRVAAILDQQELPTITTFHALCHTLLATQTGDVPQFITEHDRLLLIKVLRKAQSLKTFTSRELGLQISRLKNLPPDEVQNDAALSNLLATYNQALSDRGLQDYDDLLQRAYQLLAQHKTSFRYILVDEFQDTNSLQYQLLRRLNSTDNLCVIGDPLQSIYGFRGATSDVFDTFRSDFPECKEVTLTTNYRSTPAVVQLANAVFPDAPKLQPHRSDAGKVRAVAVLNEYSEAAWVLKSIEQALGGTDFQRSHAISQDASPHRTFRDYAVLYRTHRVGRVVQRAFAEAGIPHQIVGDGSIYEQPVPWAILQTLRYLADPSPEKLTQLARQPAFKDFSTTQVAAMVGDLNYGDAPLSQLAVAVAEKFRFVQDTLNQLTSWLVRFDTVTPVVFADYLDSLNEGTFYDPAADAVTLMTIHAAKGLEFTHVYLIGTEEDVLPSKNRQSDTDIEEERRLFYVAVTRAKESLDMLCAKNRQGSAAIPSRFITELSDEVLERVQDEDMATHQRRQQKRQTKRRQATLFDI